MDPLSRFIMPETEKHLLDLAIPPSEMAAALEEVYNRIEEQEIPFFESLEMEDRTVWVRTTPHGMTVQHEPPSSAEDEYHPESYRNLWMLMNYATMSVIEALETMTVPGEPGEDLGGDRYWSTLLASGGHGFRLFEMDFAKSILPDFREMYRRAFQITQLVLLRKPGPKASAYLRRIPKAYVFGLEAETIMLCRASLEAAVADTFERHGMPEPETMRARLDAAALFGWLGEDGRQEAWAVWRRGNTVVHQDPTAVEDVLDVIRSLVVVISELVES